MLIQYDRDILSISSLKLLLNRLKQPETWGNMVKCGHKADSLHFLNVITVVLAQRHLPNHSNVSAAPSPNELLKYNLGRNLNTIHCLN